MTSEQLREILEQMALKIVFWDPDVQKQMGEDLIRLEEEWPSPPAPVEQALAKMKQLLGKVGEEDPALLRRELEEALELLQEFVDKQPPEGLAAAGEAKESEQARGFVVDPKDMAALPEMNREFIEESQWILGAIEGELNAWAGEEDALGLVARLKRSFHKLASLAQFMDYAYLAKAAHAGEYALEQVQEGTWPLGAGLIEALKQVVQLFRQAILGLPAHWEPEADLFWAKAAQEIEECLTRGVFELPIERSRLGEILVEQGIVSQEQVQEAIKIQQVQREKRLGEILVQEKIATEEQVSTALVAQRQAAAPKREAEAASTIRIATDKLDLLLDTVGEIVIAHSLVTLDESILAIRQEATLNKLALLNRNIMTLQRLAMSLRMTPIQQVFQKLNRISRDIAQKSGKEIRVVFEGEKTEIDRNVAEFIYDPLVHMVRNAADHGLEEPEERISKGKPPVGTIRISAEYRQGQVIITVEDDGRGLNKEAILEKALRQNIVRPDQTLTDNQIYQLIFAAGLSTAAKVTEISGRGVGMDVVKTNIEKLSGKIKVDTKPGFGTVFTIILPLTLAIIDGMVVRVGSQRYVIPLTSVQEIMRPETEQVFTVQNRDEMVKLREQLYPVIRLHQIFDIPEAVINPAEGLLVVVEDGQSRAAILVDELIGKQQVVVKNLGHGFKELKGVSGAAILGQGNLGLILDLTGILNRNAVI